MKRQNSIPQPLRPPSALNNPRRKSHDALNCSSNTVSSSGGLMTSLVPPPPQNYNNPEMLLNSILVTDVGNNNNAHTLKRVTLTEETIPLPGSLSPTPSMQTITFGYASAAHHFRKASADCESGASTSEEDPNENETEMETLDEHQTGLFFLRLPDGRCLPMYCHQPVGEQADQILQALNIRFKEKLRKFLEQDKPEDGEHYVWIKNEINGKSTVLSLTQLENHFNNDKVKRVKWRHLSIDRISVYRYSVPIITTKFRLRIMHFLSQNYRCCILFVWCFVILFISVGIVLSVIFGSAPYMNSSLRRNITSGYILQK